MKDAKAKPGMPFADGAIAIYLDKQIDALKGVKTQREIAAEIGYEKPNSDFHVQARRNESSARQNPGAGEGAARRPCPPLPAGAGAVLARPQRNHQHNLRADRYGE